MPDHYNLYYLFLEDQRNNPMDPQAKARIQHKIEAFYKKTKPPWDQSSFEGKDSNDGE